MTLREVLQIELWSKETSRRILVISGVLIGVLVLGSLSFYEIDTHWFSARERNAATAALKQVDVLQSFGSLSDQEFEAKSKEAEAAVHAAEKAAVTERDRQLAFLISMYLEETRADHGELQLALMMWERRISDSGLRTQFGKKIDLTGTEIRSMTRLQLHKILN